MKNSPIPIGQKYMLSISEAAEYFNIGTKKIQFPRKRKYEQICDYNGKSYSDCP